MMYFWRVKVTTVIPDYWCCCYLQTLTILQHRQQERSETAKSFPGSSPARLAVLCKWIQSMPDCGNGCKWPSKWLWACPSNCQRKEKHLQTLAARGVLQKAGCWYLKVNNTSDSYLPFLNRNVITRACGALILAPYLKNKHSVMSNILSAFCIVNNIPC